MILHVDFSISFLTCMPALPCPFPFLFPQIRYLPSMIFSRHTSNHVTSYLKPSNGSPQIAQNKNPVTPHGIGSSATSPVLLPTTFSLVHSTPAVWSSCRSQLAKCFPPGASAPPDAVSCLCQHTTFSGSPPEQPTESSRVP